MTTSSKERKALKEVKEIKDPTPLPAGIILNGLCAYYQGAWYHGYLDTLPDRDNNVKIRPIVANKSAVPNRITVNFESIRPAYLEGGSI